MSTNRVPPHISIIIPVFNEAPTLKPLYHQIRDVMGIIESRYEMNFVGDGSTIVRSTSSKKLMAAIKDGDLWRRIHRVHQAWNMRA